MSASSRGGGRGGGGGGGGGRGRGGGGGGGGRGGGRGGAAQVPMGTLTWSEFSEVDRQKPTKSYPPMDADPKVSGPSTYESKVIAYQLGYLEHQRNSLWWPVVEDRKVREVTRYSDRYQKGQAQGQQQQQPGSTTPATTQAATATPLSSLSLSDPSIVSTLQKDAFPTQLWNVYMNAETRQQERGKKREEMRLKGDWKKVVDSVEMGGGADRLSEGAPSDDEDEGALDEYEDDEEDDYADNYFDNGEDDDIQDEGGEGAEETYE